MKKNTIHEWVKEEGKASCATRLEVMNKFLGIAREHERDNLVMAAVLDDVIRMIDCIRKDIKLGMF